MGTLKFSMSMLKKEYKKSILYTLTLCLTIAIIFFFFNIIDIFRLMNENEAALMSMGGSDISGSSILSFIIILFCACMIIFANNFYLSRKSKEMAILTMTGSSFINITLYLFYQNLVMTFIAFPLGMVLGNCLSMIINQIIYYYMNVSGSLWYFPMNATFNTLLSVIAIIFAQLIYASGYVYRKDINYLLSQQDRQVLKDHRIIRLPSFFYMFVYIFGLVILWTSPYTSTVAVVPCFMGSLTMAGMIKYCFPKIFKALKEHSLLANKIQLISLSHLYYSLTRSYTLISLFSISSSLMIAIMITLKDNFREFITTIIGFIVIMFLLLASLLYKYSMESSSQKIAYYNLYKIGYSSKQLYKIIKNEVIGFYGILLLLPMIYIMSSLGLSYYYQDISLTLFCSVVCVLVVAVCLTGILTYILYKKSIMSVLKEGMRYE